MEQRFRGREGHVVLLKTGEDLFIGGDKDGRSLNLKTTHDAITQLHNALLAVERSGTHIIRTENCVLEITNMRAVVEAAWLFVFYSPNYPDQYISIWLGTVETTKILDVILDIRYLPIA